MKSFPQFFGKVPVGTKGQIVIPAEARRAMDIKPGDSLVVISGPPHDKKMISLVSESDFNKFLKFLEGHLTTMKSQVSSTQGR